MAIIKCKMCGGDLALIEGQSVAECEYCGSRQTVPSADNEKKLALFARANKLRAACEFDKASGIYESIVADFPEEAEAYWGLVLCKYGIEYVDDPATAKKIPTCHRSSFDSVREDSNLGLTIEYADAKSRKLYQEEAKQIEELRKDIIEVSAKEDPYDIFICYKETDADGNRTLDSVLAQDTYDALTDRGYRVFFSRITLEEKLGQEYEPYIFAALNSAKVMLVFGTSFDHYNAVWVKNEWSRFLKLMEKDKSKHLIPCFKGIDAYDMPKEFARLQAQDLGKVGGLQDLLRGIDKLVSFDKKGPAVHMDSGADEIANTVTYRTALDTARKNTIKDVQDAIAQLKTISGWKDADEQLQKLEEQLAKLKKKKIIKNGFVVAIIFAVIIGFYILWTTPIGGELAAGEAPAVDVPVTATPDSPAEEPQPTIFAGDFALLEALFAGDLNNLVTYAPSGAEIMGISANFIGEITFDSSVTTQDYVLSNLYDDFLIQLEWRPEYQCASWTVYNIAHECYGIYPAETIAKHGFDYDGYSGSSPSGLVMIRDSEIEFYANFDETVQMLAKGISSVPVFTASIQQNGNEIWIDSPFAQYDMLSK